MSSLSQEDLDAGRGEVDEAANASIGAASSPSAQTSSPPISITIVTNPAPLESMIVPAMTADERDSELAENLPEPTASPEPDSAPAQSVVTRSAPASTELEESAKAIEPAESEQQELSIDVQVPESHREPPIVDPNPIDEIATNAPAQQKAAESFVAVEQKPQLLALAVVDVPFDHAADTGSPEECSERHADAQELIEVPAAVLSSTTVGSEQNVPDQTAFTLSFDYGRVLRNRRVLALTGLVFLVAISVLVSIRAGRRKTGLAQRQPQPALMETVHDALPANVRTEADRMHPTPADSGSVIGVAVPASRPSAARDADSKAESFSDAFIKHAAKVDSNWAGVKKRAKTLDSSQTAKPAASPGKPSEDPFDVLDKLEKARKSKQSTMK